MAGNSRPSFTKQAKERARRERQAEKAQKKSLRKSQAEQTDSRSNAGAPVITYDEEGQPQALDFHDF